MQTLTSLSNILSGHVFISEITPDTNEIEISIGDFMIAGEVEFNGYVIPKDYECNVPAEYVVLSQKIYPTTLFDEEGDEIELSKSDIDVINAWFQQIKLDVQI
ncbi:hypothetical protein EG346_17075 [Chryseobacterium carnipullorum]|uniref:Uncharacterized protein n=1 Tax=Chryseobacterium carnipullorum TaxID=1124835 RepID=A0A376DUA3_CHRCU|nr:hypothetical protein [Chryseobacterium carnipullorum]AZA49787.1 hypothetical protein EG346_17075 [Chryseobacterium carnipullorum]AZA64679.1 hypothetical protein EG345_08105 [Chryseobacterium carnipullorum]STC95730.1 Uncharacterised protein [Chryseobacterium carnipullorum]